LGVLPHKAVCTHEYMYMSVVEMWSLCTTAAHNLLMHHLKILHQTWQMRDI